MVVEVLEVRGYRFLFIFIPIWSVSLTQSVSQSVIVPLLSES